MKKTAAAKVSIGTIWIERIAQVNRSLWATRLDEAAKTGQKAANYNRRHWL
ncbi:MAG: hypothetical protein ACR2OR_02390 [Hyphomicrobiales bacterium]